MCLDIFGSRTKLDWQSINCNSPKPIQPVTRIKILSFRLLKVNFMTQITCRRVTKYEVFSILFYSSSKSSNIAITIRLTEQMPYFKVCNSCTTQRTSVDNPVKVKTLIISRLNRDYNGNWCWIHVLRYMFQWPSKY